MKLLLDECVTRLFKRDFVGHEVMTVAEAGYRGLKNGALLRTASAKFDVLITVDRNLQFQQNIRSLPIAVLILVAGGITYDHLKPMAPQLEDALELIRPGEIVVIETSKT